MPSAEQLITLNSSQFFSLLVANNGTESATDELWLSGGHVTGEVKDDAFWENVTVFVSSVGGQGAAQQVISDGIRDMIIIVNMAVLCQAVSVAGVLVNIFNVCIFVRQGFGDALNVTLTGLALADLGLVIFAVWLCVCYNPWFSKLDLPFVPMEFVYLTAGLPRLSCARVSSWILMYASFERCLCITMPLNFRSILTPRRSLAFMAAIYFVMALSVLPVYYTSRLVWRFDAARNRLVASLAFTSDRFAVDNVAFGIGVSLSVASFVGVVLCTAVLIWSLSKKSKWREKNAPASVNATLVPLVSHRNKRVGKMVSIISAVFIICYTPNTVNQLVMSLVQEFAKNGSQVNANQVSWSFGFLAESFNSTVTMFIYYKMSSRYRNTLLGMLGRRKAKNDKDRKSSSLSNSGF